MTGARSTDLLAGLGPMTVVGTGRAARTAAEILDVLGASVSRRAEGITAERVRAFEDHPLVIADLVEPGADPLYVAAVAGRNRGVWVTVSAFGLDGPRGGQAGSDFVCSASGGLLRAVCDESGEIYPLPSEQALQVAGQMAVLAALHGLSLGNGGAEPVHLDVSTQEAVAFCSVQQEAAHVLYRCGGTGGSRRYLAPSGAFECRDGQIGLIVIDDHQWQRVCKVVDEPGFAERFPRAADRRAHGDEIYRQIEPWFAGRSKLEAEGLLQAAGVAAIAIRSPREVMASEQLSWRHFLRAPGLGTLNTELLPAEVAPLRDPQQMARSQRPLEAMRVAEVTNVLAGPLAGAILGAMGADVVRLEETARLDIYRRNGPFADGQPGQERAAYFLFANYCKRSVSRRVGVDDGFGGEVLQWAHLVLENVGSARLDRLGLTAPADADHSLISISGFGRTGPCADYRAYAPNVHAYAGLTGAVQRGASQDITIWSSFADYSAAVWAATLAAGWWMGGTTGRRFDLSMAEVIAAKLNGLPLDEDSPGAVGVHDVLIRCGEDYVAVSASDEEYAELLDAFPVQARPAAFGRTVAADAPSLSGQELADAMTGAGFRASLAHSSADVLGDPQLAARGFVVELPHPEVGLAPIFALPWKPAGTARHGYRRAPMLGEDDDWFDHELTMAETRPR